MFKNLGEGSAAYGYGLARNPFENLGKKYAVLDELRGAFRLLEMRYGVEGTAVVGVAIVALFAAPGEVIDDKIASRRAVNMDYRLANLGDWLRANTTVEGFPGLKLSLADQMARRLPEHQLKIPRLNALVDNVSKAYGDDSLMNDSDPMRKGMTVIGGSVLGFHYMSEIINRALTVEALPIQVAETLFAGLLDEGGKFAAGASPTLRLLLSDRTGGNLGIIRKALGMEEAVGEVPAWRLLKMVLGAGEKERLALAAKHLGKKEAEVTGSDKALFYADLVMDLDERDILTVDIREVANITPETAREQVLEALRGLAAAADVFFRQMNIYPGDITMQAETNNQLLRFLAAVKQARREDLMVIVGKVLKVESPGESDLRQFYADMMETAIAAGARLQDEE